MPDEFIERLANQSPFIKGLVSEGVTRGFSTENFGTPGAGEPSSNINQRIGQAFLAQQAVLAAAQALEREATGGGQGTNNQSPAQNPNQNSTGSDR